MTPLQEHPVHLLFTRVVSFAGAKEPGVRLFFRPFLIVHLAQGSDMDGAIWGLRLPNPTRHACVPLNPKCTSIPSGVFRKGLKKGVRFGSSLRSPSLFIGCCLGHKPASNEVLKKSTFNDTRIPHHP